MIPEVAASTKATLVFGATGKTGRHVVECLLERGHRVKAVVRSKNRLEEALSSTSLNGSIMESRKQKMEALEVASFSDLSDQKLSSHLRECDSVICCLGKNGDAVFSEPRRLVSDTTKQICSVMQKENNNNNNTNNNKKKFILMGSEMVDVEGDTSRSFLDRAVLGLLRRAIPPHQDNEEAASCLMQHKEVDDKPSFEWSIVRPTALTDSDEKKSEEYKVLGRREHGVFAGKSVTRKAVGTFLADLVTNDDLWNKWKFQAPVVHGTDD